MRKFLADPIMIDNRCDFILHECTYPKQQVLVILTQDSVNMVKIAFVCRKWLLDNTHDFSFLKILSHGLYTVTLQLAGGWTSCRTTPSKNNHVLIIGGQSMVLSISIIVTT